MICTTHFLEIFSLGLVVDGADGIKALQMKVYVPETGNATPLFQLEDGIATSSAGLVCAKMAGVRPAIITRAGEIIGAMKTGHRVEPLTEILCDELELSVSAKETVGYCMFGKTDWIQASNEEIAHFRELIIHL